MDGCKFWLFGYFSQPFHKPRVLLHFSIPYHVDNKNTLNTQFTNLPGCLLDRIGFFILLDGGMRGILNLSRTCAKLHKHFTGFLLTVVPLTVSKKRKKKTLSYKRLSVLSKTHSVFIRDLRLFDYKYEVTLPNFVFLTSLTVEAASFSFLLELHELPKLTTLTLIYSHRLVGKRPLSKLEGDLTRHFEEHQFPALQILRVFSKKQIINNRFKIFFSRNSIIPQRLEEYDRYFSSKKAQKNFSIEKGKHSLLGRILFKIIEKTRKSLKMIEVSNLDFSYIMAANRKIKFPQQCYILLNNASIVHAYSWLRKIDTRKRVTVMLEDEIALVVHIYVKHRGEETIRHLLKNQTLVRDFYRMMGIS